MGLPAVVACGVLSLDLRHVAEKLGTKPHFEFLPGGLHEDPEDLRRRLQQKIDLLSADDRFDRIVIGYGICGLGTTGIRAGRIPLAIPRVHDCIALFLGGDSAYRREHARCPGTYFISAGWHAEKAEPLTQRRSHVFIGGRKVLYRDLVRQFGEDHARHTFDFFNSWKKNYRRAAFIDTGVGGSDTCAAYARQMAEECGWQYERLEGDHSLLTKLMAGQATTDSVLLVPPGYITTFDSRLSGLSACPQLETVAGKPAKTQRIGHLRATQANDPISACLGLGIDSGGTYTDAVIFDLGERRLLSKSKALTTKFDFTIGISEALDGIDHALLRGIDLVAVSTTLATNAIVEDQGQKVGLLLMPPYEGFNTDAIPFQPKAVIRGRMSIDGKVLEPVDEQQIRRTVRHMVDKESVDAFAVSSYGGVVNPILELEVKRIVRAEQASFVCCGHELSELLDFQTRARTAALNARIVPLLMRLLEDLSQTLAQLRIDAPIMVVKGDGSLMSSAMAIERPVETILSGPAASVAGARYLTGQDDAVVVDMGGTTTDTAVLSGGRVQIDESGSRVQDMHTHVRALEIRTSGLGGDSSINYENNTFHIGPRRVAPIAWLAFVEKGATAAFDYMEANAQRFRLSLRNLQLLKLNGGEPKVPLSDEERRIVDLLHQRPYTLDELTRRFDALHPTLLPIDRLESAFVIQRCGLTPTDLLHQAGRFEQWDKEAAARICMLVAKLVDMPLDRMVAMLLSKISRRLALEIMKKQLDRDTQVEVMDHCRACKTLVDRMLGQAGNGYRVQFRLDHPVIGIGAPIEHFLPAAARRLGTRAVIPEHAAVANAIGAITSSIVIRRTLRIRPDLCGGFCVDGLAGAARFPQFEEAETHARNELVRNVRALARLAGTAQEEVELQVEDRTAKTGYGEELFIERQIIALLVGRPDLSKAPAAADGL